MHAEYLGDNARVIVSDPLDEVDRILTEMAKAPEDRASRDSHRLTVALCRALLNLDNGTDSSEILDPTAKILDPTLPAKIRRTAAAAFVHILVTDYLNLDEGFRHHAFALIDREFQSDLYPHINISPRDQTHNKLTKLSDTLHGTSQALTSAVASLSNLHTFSDVRKSFMKTINSSPCKFLIWPFLPDTPTNLGVNRALEAVRCYLDATVSTVAQEFREAQQTLEQCHDRVASYRLRYCLHPLNTMYQTLHKTLDQHFLDSPHSKPARVTVRASDKKYPLHIADQQIGLFLDVQNAGPGDALGIEIELASNEDIFIHSACVMYGLLAPITASVEIPATVKHCTESASAYAVIRWTNSDGTKDQDDVILAFIAQRTDIDWESLDSEEPYDLEPVGEEDHLVGRVDYLRKLTSLSRSKSLGSCYIFG